MHILIELIFIANIIYNARIHNMYTIDIYSYNCYQVSVLTCSQR